MAEKRLHKRIKRFSRYWILRALFWAVGLLPLSAAKRLGAALGRLAFALAGKERRKALASLATAFPQKTEAERLALARDCFRHLGVVGAEVCQVRHIDQRLEEYVELSPESQKLLSDLHAAGKGVIYITGHVGNFELMARRIGRLGFPCGTIAKESSDPRMTSLIQRVRESGGYKIIWRGKDGVFEDLQRLLAAGEFIGFLIDQDIKAKGVFVHFFGVKAFTPRAAADLALLTGAAVVTGFAFRRQDGGHRVEITRIPVPPSAPQVVDQEVVALTQTFTRAIEDAICRDPHAWVWMHQRWKTRPT